MKDLISRINTTMGYKMFDEDIDLLVLLKISNTKGFNKDKFEKDFYLSIILHWISNELPQIKFKGGTCLNKIYFPYFRMSEDLDFCMSIDDELVNSNNKRAAFAQTMREKMKVLTQTMGRVINEDKFHHKKAQGNTILKKKEYTYLKYVISYTSIYANTTQTIKVELTYMHKQYLSSQQQQIHACFIDTITEEKIFPLQTIQCLALEEMMAEKMRAALTRRVPAIRDFFDIRYVKQQGFDFEAIRELINQKVAEAGHRYTAQHHYTLLQEQIAKDLDPVLNAGYNFDFESIYHYVLTFMLPHAQ